MNNNHDINLNIHYTAPDEVWEKINHVYKNMPYWDAFEPIPHWVGDGINLTASVEPGGIQIYGEMPEGVWDDWYKTLKDNLTQALGYEIGEPEDGFRFKYWTPFVKEYSDIKSIDKKAIVFNDFSTFFFDEIGCGDRDRKIDAEPPYFSFKTDYIELRIVFNKTGRYSKKKNIEDFYELYKRLNEVGQTTRDLS